MAAFILIFCFIFFLIPIGIGVFTIISLWKIFQKAGKGGWESIIPVYSNIVLIEISGLPLWYIALLFVPFANIYAQVRIYLELSYRFKQSTAFGIGLYFLCPIFLGILAFNKDITYESLQPYVNSFCKNCGNKIKAGDKFCTNCGTGAEIPKGICLTCGNKIKSGENFCTHCGSKI